MHTLAMWGGIFVFITVLLLIDLGVFNKKDHVPSLKEATIYSLFYIGASCLFGLFVYWYMGDTAGLQFFTGFLIEKSMSVDNLMMFIVIFTYFKVPAQYHHRVLFWGVVGAIALRLVLIYLGAKLVAAFHPLLLVFAALLLFASYKIFFMDDDDGDEYQENAVVKWFAKHTPMTDKFDGHNFTTRVLEGGRSVLKFTPLALVLVAVETTDLMFATDSIPAIFSVSSDPFILFSSNVCAILGLRALFFVVEHVLNKLCYLKKALGLVLAFVGFKMVLEGLNSIFELLHWPVAAYWTSFHVSTGASLWVIAGILTAAVVISLLFPKTKAAEDESETARTPDRDR